MKKGFVWFCALILGLSTITFFPLKTRAATLDVCPVGCTYATIAAALAAANDGDIITVGAGVYNETLNIPNKNNLSLIGAGASSTTISNNLAPITNANAVTNLRIEGFTLSSTTQNGFSCIVIAGESTGIITNNIFTNNSAAGAAGIGLFGGCGYEISHNTFSTNTNGVYNLGNSSASNIHNNTFTSNTYTGIFLALASATNNLVHSNTFTLNGFGVHSDISAASIYNNDIHNNGTQATNEPGAGISAEGSTLQIYANKIYQNTDPSAGGGLAMMSSGANANVFNNYISQNEVTLGPGGGIYSIFDGTPIYNNTIVNNTATGGSPSGFQGSAGQIMKSSDPALQEKIDATFAQNEDYWNNAQINLIPSTKGGGAWIGHGPASIPAFYNNIVWGNTDNITDMDGDLVVNYSDVQEPWTGSGTGNKSSDPVLTGYVLGEGSPCIDAGTSAGAPSHDIDGTARPQRNGYDIGAYELPAATTLPESGGQGNNQNLILVLISALSAALIFIATRRIIKVKN